MKRTVLAWLAAIVLLCLVILAVGESPFNVLKILALSAFGGAENFSYTLFYATPMLLTGVAVSLALSSGLFNIGAEGQLYMGSIFAISWGLLTKNWQSPVLVWSGGILSAFAGGALWGGIAGYLRMKRQTHEVIATIMLNFIGMAFVNWMILNVYKNTENQSLETHWIPESARMGRMWMQSTVGLPAALLLAGLVLFAVRKTWIGYRIRATGLNPVASGLAGINTNRMGMVAMIVSGGIAGLVGFHEVFCNSYRLIDGFSPGYGFTGLAIALIARGNFPKLVIAALLFGALNKGALDLDLETEKVTRDLSAVIQAIILVSLAMISVEKKRSPHG